MEGEDRGTTGEVVSPAAVPTQGVVGGATGTVTEDELSVLPFMEGEDRGTTGEVVSPAAVPTQGVVGGAAGAVTEDELSVLPFMEGEDRGTSREIAIPWDATIRGGDNKIFSWASFLIRIELSILKRTYKFNKEMGLQA